ncbi:MAG TPA: esterase, partial [Spirochaetia bacterium]|nr:esterase [Spirochaetia bacterium]
MRKLDLFIVILLAAGLLSCGGDNASPDTPRLVKERVAAPSLHGNLLGDPEEQTVIVILPPTYHTAEQRYPVVYFLHGFTRTAYDAIDFFNYLDSAMQSGVVREFILVGVNGHNALQGSFYVNSAVTGNWEDHVVKEVIPHIDAHYRTIPERRSRGLMGHSM